MQPGVLYCADCSTAGRSRLCLAECLPGVKLSLLVKLPHVQTGSARAGYPGDHFSGRVADSCSPDTGSCQTVESRSLLYLGAAAVMHSQHASSPTRLHPAQRTACLVSAQGGCGLAAIWACQAWRQLLAAAAHWSCQHAVSPCAGNFIEDDDGAGYGDLGEEDEWGAREEEAEAAPANGDREAVSKKRKGGRDAAAGAAAAATLQAVHRVRKWGCQCHSS